MRDPLADSAVAGAASGGVMGTGFGFEVGFMVCVISATTGCEAAPAASAVSQSRCRRRDSSGTAAASDTAASTAK